MKFYNFINLYRCLNLELDNDDIQLKNKIKNINDNFIILLNIKKIIEEKNFINKLENNYGVYIEIDEIITKLNEVINDIDKYNDKEIVSQDKKIFDNIRFNIIKELLVLHNNSEKIMDKFEFMRLKNSSLFDFYDEFDFPFFGNYYNNMFKRKDISDYNKIFNSFYRIEKLKLEDLKLIYLYCLERIKKNSNPKYNDLSIIERMYFECSFNTDKENNEWFEYISEKQSYNYEIRNKYKNEFKLNQIQIINLFRCANNLNEELLSKKESEDIDINVLLNSIFDLNKFDIKQYDFFMKVIIKNIVKFAGTITGQKFALNDDKNNINYHDFLYVHRFSERENYYVDKDESLIAKLKEIYELGDITLLTFYEFIWFEENYDICEGFLSSLKNNIQYNLRMRKHILNIKEEMKPKIKAKYKKEKKFKKKSDNILLKLRKKNDSHFRSEKPAVWKIRIPFKLKKKNNIKK